MGAPAEVISAMQRRGLLDESGKPTARGYALSYQHGIENAFGDVGKALFGAPIVPRSTFDFYAKPFGDRPDPNEIVVTGKRRTIPEKVLRSVGDTATFVRDHPARALAAPIATAMDVAKPAVDVAAYVRANPGKAVDRAAGEAVNAWFTGGTGAMNMVADPFVGAIDDNIELGENLRQGDEPGAVNSARSAMANSVIAAPSLIPVLGPAARAAGEAIPAATGAVRSGMRAAASRIVPTVVSEAAQDVTPPVYQFSGAVMGRGHALEATPETIADLLKTQDEVRVVTVKDGRKFALVGRHPDRALPSKGELEVVADAVVSDPLEIPRTFAVNSNARSASAGNEAAEIRRMGSTMGMGGGNVKAPVGSTRFEDIPNLPEGARKLTPAARKAVEMNYNKVPRSDIIDELETSPEVVNRYFSDGRKAGLDIPKISGKRRGATLTDAVAELSAKQKDGTYFDLPTILERVRARGFDNANMNTVKVISARLRKQGAEIRPALRGTGPRLAQERTKAATQSLLTSEGAGTGAEQTASKVIVPDAVKNVGAKVSGSGGHWAGVGTAAAAGGGAAALAPREADASTGEEGGGGEIPLIPILGAAGLAALGARGLRGMKGMRSQTSMFAGPAARTADREALKRAEQMEAQGLAREQIHKETGWFKGTDGKWRFEIDDSGAKIGPKATEEFLAGEELETTGRAPPVRARKMAGALHHKPLYDAYPDMRKITVTTQRGSGAPSGMFQRAEIDGVPQPGDITARAGDTGELRSVILHEGQHGIQRQEGFSVGDNISAVRSRAGDRVPTPEAEAIRQELKALDAEYKSGTASEARKAQIIEEAFALTKRQSEEGDRYLMDQYRRTAGEVEARNVQTRRDFTPEQRRAQPPWTTEDVPADQQIVRFDGGDAASAPRKRMGGIVPSTVALAGASALAPHEAEADTIKGQGSLPDIQYEPIQEGERPPSWESASGEPYRIPGSQFVAQRYEDGSAWVLEADPSTGALRPVGKVTNWADGREAGKAEGNFAPLLAGVAAAALGGRLGRFANKAQPQVGEIVGASLGGAVGAGGAEAAQGGDAEDVINAGGLGAFGGAGGAGALNIARRVPTAVRDAGLRVNLRPKARPSMKRLRNGDALKRPESALDVQERLRQAEDARWSQRSAERGPDLRDVVDEAPLYTSEQMIDRAQNAGARSLSSLGLSARLKRYGGAAKVARETGLGEFRSAAEATRAIQARRQSDAMFQAKLDHLFP